MKNISNAFKEELNNGNRNFVKSCTITLADGTELPITQADTWQNGFSIDEAVSSDNTFDLGSAIVDEFDLTLNNIYEKFSAYDFTDAVITNVRIGLVLPNGTTEYVKRGVFTVDEARYNGSAITLECLDNMIKFDKNYSVSNLTYPTTLLNIVKDACSCCNVSMASDIASFPNSGFTVSTRPISEGLTFRKILTWVAQICGIWFKCNESGQLSAKVLDMALVDSLSGNIDGGTFSPWTDGDTLDGGTFNPWSTGDTVDGGTFSDMSKYHHIFSIINPDITTDDVVVTGVQVKEQVSDELKTYLNGTTGYVLSIEENGLIQNGNGSTVASYLGNKFVGLRFRPLTVSCLTDPSIEAGDLAYVTDRHNRSYFTIITRQTLTPGKFQEIACNAETPKKNSSSRYSQSTQIYQEFRKNLEKQKTEFDKAIEELSTKLSQTEGAYTTIEKLESGGSIFYLHNKPTVAESQMIWKMTAEAWGVTTDGGKTWNAGMTVDGVVIAKILNTIGVNADWINTGALTIKDDNGNEIFTVDKDTNRVYINAAYVTIGGKSVTQAIADVESTANNALTTANNAQALSIVMSNEYQGVPTDANGNYTTFPAVTTKITTYFGHTDVSSACTYSVSTSSGITGSWNSSTRTYTVTALTADTAYVDITASYLSTFTVTKRFTVAKVKAGQKGDTGSTGPQGAAGRTYFLQPSTLTMKIGADSVISPSTVTFSAYYRDGTSATRTAYACRFIIAESTDGSSYVTKYTSSANEASKTYTPSSTDVVAIRCTMYAAGGTTTALDVQTVTLLIDVDNLSQEQIFNILTNNGAVQGIYLEGGRIYINGSYIQSGTVSADLIKAGSLYIGLKPGDSVTSSKVSGIYFTDVVGKVKASYALTSGWRWYGSDDSEIQFMELSGDGMQFYRSYTDSSGTTVSYYIDDFIEFDWENDAINADFSHVTTTTFTMESTATVTSGTTAVFDSSSNLKKLASSSERYKDIERMLTAEDIENLYNIEVYWAKYKDDYLDENDERYRKYMPMFTVENMEQYLPIAVNHNADGSPEMWNAQIMIPVMFQMLKSQRDEIDNLKNLLSMKGVI